MNEIDAIKNALREAIEAAVSRGNLSPEIKSLIAKAIAHAETRITELRGSSPIPAGAENLWVLAGGNPQAFQSYAQNFPNPAINKMAANPSALANTEAQLGQRITLPGGEAQGGIPKAPLNSSNVYGFNYDPSDGTLRVRFQGGGIYEYDSVPPSIFKAFQAGAIPARTNGQNQYGQWWIGKKPSLGASFFNLIRDQYPYQRVA